MSKINANISAEERKMLNTAMWKSGTTRGSFNYVKMLGQGYVYCIMPFINKYYKTEEERKEAIIRANSFMNTNNMCLPFILGLNIAMEKKRAETGEISAEAISSTKTSLMGPMAGIGDSFQFNTLRVIAAGIGISLASQGSILGPILMLLIYFIPFVLIRKQLMFAGFSVGTTMIDKRFNGGILKRVTNAASIVGVIMIGSLVAQMVNVSTALTLNLGSAEIVLQQIFDSIMPGMLSVGMVFGIIALVKKGIKPVMIVCGVMVMCILGAVVGIF